MSQETMKRSVTPDEIISLARECVGTPFKHQGRVPGRGMDCVGLVRYPAAKLGILDIDFLAYSSLPNPREMRYRLNDVLQSKVELEPSDILWLALYRIPMHLAIFTGSSIIHAMGHGPKRVVEHDYVSPWTERTVQCFAYPGVRDG